MIKTRDHASFLSFITATRSPLNEYRIGERRLVYLPFCETKSSAPVFTAGFAYELLHFCDPAKRHTVTIMLSAINGDPEFHFVCGDTFLSGTNSGGNSVATKRIKAAAKATGLFDTEPVSKLMMECYNSFPPDSGCSFWRNLRNDPDGAGCKHVAGVLEEIYHNGAEKVIGELQDAYDDALDGLLDLESVTSDEELSIALERLAGPTIKSKFPVLIEGETGVGKTTALRIFSDQFEEYQEAQGHDGMESYDFLGGMIRGADGSYVWLDGPVTRAFRLAAKGRKTLLNIDEIYRVPPRERSLFLSALSPFRGRYMLQTGRAVNVQDGIAEMEMISAPVDNLSIVASTNNGIGYDVRTGDKALQDRWVHIVYQATQARVGRVLRFEVEAQSMNEDVVAKLQKFRALCEKLMEQRHITQVPSSRLLARAVAIAGSEDKLKEGLYYLIPNLVGRTPNGALIPEQMTALKKAITKAIAA